MLNVLFPNQIETSDLIRYYNVYTNKLELGLVVNSQPRFVNKDYMAEVQMLTKIGMQFNILIRGCILISRVKC